MKDVRHVGLTCCDAQSKANANACATRSEKMVEILRAGGSARATDVALQTQRLTLDIVGLVAFSHDFRQAELTRRRAPQATGICLWLLALKAIPHTL